MAGKSNKGRNRGKGSNAANSAELATEPAAAPGSLNEKSGAVESSKAEANGVEKSDAAIEASEPADAKPEAADAASAASGNRTKQADGKPKFRWILPLCFAALVSTGVCYYAVPDLRRWVREGREWRGRERMWQRAAGRMDGRWRLTGRRCSQAAGEDDREGGKGGKVGERRESRAVWGGAGRKIFPKNFSTVEMNFDAQFNGPIACSEKPHLSACSDRIAALLKMGKIYLFSKI